MRIILEINNGPQQGQRVWLRTDQVMQIGRSHWADLCIDDPALAEVHLALYATDAVCRVRDLRSGTGVFVNDLQVVEHSLANGDMIRAGNTQLRVLIEGIRSDSTASKPADEAYRCVARGNGLVCYRPVNAQSPASPVLDQLTSVSHVYYVGWFDEWGSRRPAELKTSLDTVPASPNATWGKFLPLLMAPAELEDPAEYFERAWKNRQVIALVADLPKAELLAALREQPYLYSSLEAAEHFLLTMPAEQLAPAIAMLQAIVLPEKDGSWQMLANPVRVASWQDLAFELPPVA